MKVLIGLGNTGIALEVIHLLQQGGHSVQLATETEIVPGTYKDKITAITEPKSEPYYTCKETKGKGEKKRQRSEWNRRMK